MIPKPSLYGNINLYFMAYYFPYHLAKRLGKYETLQNRLTREWILRLKKINKKDSESFEHHSKQAFELFNFLLESFIKKISANSALNGGKIGLLAIPGSQPGSDNAVSLLTKNLCLKDSNTINLSPAILRKSYCDSKNSSHEEKLESLCVDKSVLEKFFIPSHKKILMSDEIYDGSNIGQIIIIDDVYTSGGTFAALHEKLFSTEDPYRQFFSCTNVYFFSFGKTLSEEEIKENNFSNSSEIKLPKLNNDVFSQTELRDMRNSINYFKYADPYNDPFLHNLFFEDVLMHTNVVHPSYGRGYITGYSRFPDPNQWVRVFFESAGEKTIDFNRAKLKIKRDYLNTGPL